MKLPTSYYQNTDVVFLAKDLLGKRLITLVDGIKTSGIITETEAYNGVDDKACHAYGGRRTKRTETMYLSGGHAYVYLCYGIHQLFNVVTSIQDDPKAVLIRAVYPDFGIDTVLKRRKKLTLNSSLCGGPGMVSQGLAIGKEHNALSLQSEKIWIENTNLTVRDKDILIGPRIGIDYAEEDALLPYRFVWNYTPLNTTIEL